MHVSRETVYLSTDVDFWYYGEDGPCARPTSYYNANHEQRSWIIEFLASKGNQNNHVLVEGGCIVCFKAFIACFKWLYHVF